MRPIVDYSDDEDVGSDRHGRKQADGLDEKTRRKDKKLLDEEVKRIEREKIEDEDDRRKLKEDEFLKR